MCVPVRPTKAEVTVRCGTTVRNVLYKCSVMCVVRPKGGHGQV